MLLGYTLTDDQLMELAEKSEVLDVDEQRVCTALPYYTQYRRVKRQRMGWSLFTIEK